MHAEQSKDLPQVQAPFWAVMDSVQDVPDLEERAEAVGAALASMTAEEVDAYRLGYVDAHRQIYTWRHWGAAEAFQGFVSDDVFFDLRGWVLLHGSDRYARFLSDPDTLGEFGLRDEEEMSAGELLDDVDAERRQELGLIDAAESDEFSVYAQLDEPAGEKLPDGTHVRDLFPRNAKAGEGQPWYLEPTGFDD